MKKIAPSFVKKTLLPALIVGGLFTGGIQTADAAVHIRIVAGPAVWAGPAYPRPWGWRARFGPRHYRHWHRWHHYRHWCRRHPWRC